MNASAIVTLRGVQVPVLGWIPLLGCCTRLAVILINMMVAVAPAAWARARPRTRTSMQRWSGTRLTPSLGQIAGAWGLVIVHGLVTLFLEVIALAIILFVIGLVAPHVLVIAWRAIMMPIVLMTIVRLSIIAVPLVIVTIFMTAMLTVAWFTATCNRKLSHFPFLWLLVLGNLLENASCLVGCLTLLEEGNHLEWVSRHRLVQVGELVLVHLGLGKEDLLNLLLQCSYVHCLTVVTTLKVAENLYLTLHELVHWHESRLLRSTEQANQLVTYVWESGDSLKIIPDTLVEVCLRTICIVWALLCNDAGPLSQAYALKALTHEVE